MKTLTKIIANTTNIMTMTENKIVSYRFNMITRQIEEKQNLLRLVKINGILHIDLNQEMMGRGFYLSKEKELIKMFFKKAKGKYGELGEDLISYLEKQNG